MVMRSTLRTGVSSAAVPVKNTSSAMYSISRGMCSSRTGIPCAAASCMMVWRVIPPRMLPSSGVVMSAPSDTMNTFCPDPSLTIPDGLSAIPSA
jgi:hypothetical protein